MDPVLGDLHWTAGVDVSLCHVSALWRQREDAVLLVTRLYMLQLGHRFVRTFQQKLLKVENKLNVFKNKTKLQYDFKTA